jgi:hypothetical protein
VIVCVLFLSLSDEREIAVFSQRKLWWLRPVDFPTRRKNFYSTPEKKIQEKYTTMKISLIGSVLVWLLSELAEVR